MTDLTDRMRTCAAHVLSLREEEGQPPWMRDAADLLIEASNVLEATPEPLGEPMAIIPLGPTRHMPSPETPVGTSTWIDPGGTLPLHPTLGTWAPGTKPRPLNGRACPQCDSRTNKKVVRQGNKLTLVCPVCSTTWEWKR